MVLGVTLCLEEKNYGGEQKLRKRVAAFLTENSATVPKHVKADEAFKTWNSGGEW